MTTSKPEKPLDTNYGEYWSGKKPYLVHDYRQMMKKKTQEEYFFHELSSQPMSELYKPYWIDDDVEPGMGWEYMAPPYQFPQLEPPGVTLPGTDCALACNPASLNCSGGCNIIACICGKGGLSAQVVYDPTGGLLVAAPINDTMVSICLLGSGDSIAEEYPTALVKVTDGSGEEYTVEVQLINCRVCCEPFELAGDATVSPGETWTGTITPACPNAVATAVAGHNTNCDDWEAVLSEDGTQVTVATAEGDAGTIIVTITDEFGSKCSNVDSLPVKILNEGQGGDYTACFGSGACQTCEVGFPWADYVGASWSGPCDDGGYYGWEETGGGLTRCWCSTKDGGGVISCVCGGDFPCDTDCTVFGTAPCEDCGDFCTPGAFCYNDGMVDWWQTGECQTQWTNECWTGNCA